MEKSICFCKNFKHTIWPMAVRTGKSSKSQNTHKKLELNMNWEPLCVFIIIYVFISNLLAIYLIYLLVTVSIYFTECCLCVKNDPISDRSPNTKDEYLSSLNVRRFSSPDRCVSISIAKLAYPSMFLVHMCCMSRLGHSLTEQIETQRDR